MFGNLFKRKEKSVEEKMREELGLELIPVDEGTINKFRKYIRGASNLTDEEVIYKINRDFYCSNIISKENNQIIIKKYGNLKIVYSKKSKSIVRIYNKNTYGRCYDVDELLKNKLNRIMGL